MQNYLFQTRNAACTLAGFVDLKCSDDSVKPGEWRTMVPNKGGFLAVKRVKGSRSRKECIQMRNDIKDYSLNKLGKMILQKTPNIEVIYIHTYTYIYIYIYICISVLKP